MRVAKETRELVIKKKKATCYVEDLVHVWVGSVSQHVACRSSPDVHVSEIPSCLLLEVTTMVIHITLTSPCRPCTHACVIQTNNLTNKGQGSEPCESQSAVYWGCAHSHFALGVKYQRDASARREVLRHCWWSSFSRATVVKEGHLGRESHHLVRHTWPAVERTILTAYYWNQM